MQGQRQLEFTFLAGPEEGKTFTFKGKSVSIGSGRGNELVIKDPYVNPTHAVITIEDAGIMLVNRAVNGATFVNGNRVERIMIENDDTIAFGGTISVKFRTLEVAEGFQAPFRTPIAPSFRLNVVGGLLKGMNYDYAKEQVVIGSRRGCDMLLGDAGVEAEHARIIAEGSELVLHNRSNAGVKVNGKLVERSVLHNGDKIEVGQAALQFQETMGDVRLAKPRKGATDTGPVQRSARGPSSIFRNPFVIAGLLIYFWGFSLVVMYIVFHKSSEEALPFGGGFGFHSVSRGIFVTKTIGHEFYENEVKLVGHPEEENPSFRIVSGNVVLYSSSEPINYPTRPDEWKALEVKWPKSPPFKRTIISDPAEANRSLALGREHYNNRNLNPNGLFHAIRHFRRAEAYCPPTEATTLVAIKELLLKCELGLFEFYEDSWERAYIKAKARDLTGAAHRYEFLRSLVPDDRNPGNRYARAAQLEIISNK